jgi:hypothetical protein
MKVSIICILVHSIWPAYFGSVLGVWIRIRREKRPPKIEKKVKKFDVLKYWMFSLERVKASDVAFTEV